MWQTCGQTEKYSYREFAAQVFAAVVPTAALYSHCVAQVVDFYLGGDKESARKDLVQLIRANDKAASSRALAYVHEALRQDPPVSPFWLYPGDIFSVMFLLWQVPGVLRRVLKDDVLESTEVNVGSYVFASVVKANQDVSHENFLQNFY